MNVLRLWVALALTTFPPALFRLDSLTVPVNRLPLGCRLAPVPTSATGEPQIVAYPGLTENPWIGRLSDIEKLRGASCANPSRARSTSDSRSAILHSTCAQSRAGGGGRGAYRALYVAANGMKVDVYAIQFTDPKLADKALLRSLQDGVRVVVRGTLVIRILGGVGGTCFQAVIDHMTSLKPPDQD